MSDPWLRDTRDRVQLAAEAARIRARRCQAILDAHAGGVQRWSAPLRDRLDRIAERLGGLLERGGILEPRPAPTWPWRRWAGGALVAPLTPEDVRDWPRLEQRRRPWLERQRGFWRR